MFFPFTLFKSCKASNPTNISLTDINSMLTSSDIANLHKTRANMINSDTILSKKKELYISLDNILQLIENKGELTVDNLMSKCRHLSELTGTGTSILVDAIPHEDGKHIILCQDMHNCELHKGFLGDKIHITMIKKVTKK